MKIIREDRPLQEMSRVGNTRNLYVVIYDNEGPIPYFHVYGGMSFKSSKFESCVRLDKAEYFLHNSMQSKLNSKQKKELIEFLNSPDEYYPEETHYVSAVKLWNRNNKFKMSIGEIPNYLELE